MMTSFSPVRVAPLLLTFRGDMFYSDKLRPAGQLSVGAPHSKGRKRAGGMPTARELHEKTGLG